MSLITRIVAAEAKVIQQRAAAVTNQGPEPDWAELEELILAGERARRLIQVGALDEPEPALPPDGLTPFERLRWLVGEGRS